MEEEGEEEYYENDSFIIDDDGANDRDGDLTGSSARSDHDLHVPSLPPNRYDLRSEVESPYSSDKKESKVSL